MSEGVKFIRVRGRVVPVSKQSKETLKRRKSALEKSPNNGKTALGQGLKGAAIGGAAGGIYSAVTKPHTIKKTVNAFNANGTTTKISSHITKYTLAKRAIGAPMLLGAVALGAVAAYKGHKKGKENSKRLEYVNRSLKMKNKTGV